MVALLSLGELRKRLEAGYESSVFRRAFLLLALVVPAFVANFLVLYVCAQWLGAADFGVFYAANAIGNILFSGSLILNLAFTRYLSTLAAAQGPKGLIAGAYKIQSALLRWGSLVTAALIASGVLAGSRIGVRSAIVVVLVVLDAYTAYLGDIGRVLLQVSRRTIALGLYTLVWMALRLVLCMVGLWWGGTVWGALAGIVLSSVAMIVALNVFLARQPRSATQSIGHPPRLTSELPSIVGYGLLVTVSNLDVLVGYFILPSVAFGLYSASAVLPKAILTVVTPLQQMLFPHMVAGSGDDTDNRRFRLRAGIAVVGIAALGTVMAAIVEPIACGASPGIVLCRPSLMNVILLSIVPLVLVRVILLDDIVGYRPHNAFLLLIPLVGYALWTVSAAHGLETTLAWSYLVCSLAAAAILVVAREAPRLLRRSG